MSVHETLVAARNSIDREGWCQVCFGGTRDGSAPVCTTIAIYDLLPAVTHVRARWEIHEVIAKVLGLQFDHPAEIAAKIWDWNDAPGRTKSEVVALFDEAIRQTAPTPDLSFLNDRIAERDQNALFFGPIFEEAKS